MSSIVIAYLDPGTGSVIVQAILGGLAAAAVTVRLWWHRVTSIFRRGSSDETQPQAPAQTPAETERPGPQS
jgi:hypothetical protein